MFITVTNNFVNNTLIKPDDINQNFTDIINGTSDGTKDIKVEALTIASDLNITGESSFGNNIDDKIEINSIIDNDIIPNANGSYEFGTSVYPFKRIILDNSTTDGGTIYFNLTATKYIQSDSDGNVLTIAGFGSGVNINTDGYFRMGEGSDLELVIESDNFVIRNRTIDKDISFYGNVSGTDTEFIKVDSSEATYFSRSILDGVNVNAIINGDFKIWQRASYVETFSPTEYTADRWYRESGGTGTINSTFTRSDDTPSINASNTYYSLLVEPDNTNTNADAYLFFSQKIEGYDIHGLINNPVVISFWVKSSKIGTYSVALRNSGKDYSYVAEYTIDNADTWEYKTISVSSIDNSSGTWNYSNGCGLELLFCLKGSTTYDTSTLNTWQGANYFSSTNQVNFVDSTANDFYITNISINKGKVAIPFNHTSFQKELKRCERYYENSYNYGFDTLHTFVTANAYGGVPYKFCLTTENYVGRSTVRFRTRKRTAPDTSPNFVKYRSTNSGLSDKVYDSTGTERNLGAGGYTDIGETGFRGQLTSLSVNSIVLFHYECDAEIY